MADTTYIHVNMADATYIHVNMAMGTYNVTALHQILLEMTARVVNYIPILLRIIIGRIFSVLRMRFSTQATKPVNLTFTFS